MKTTPYSNAAPWRLWPRAVAAPPQAEVDPMLAAPFRIAPSARIVTAGSCFAQHIGRHLAARGFTHHITEPAHPVLDEATARAFNFGIYAARYGNIYTARQLLQLFQRAHGQFVPGEESWHQNGVFFDPFRPAIQPGGFASEGELHADRAQHFAATRRAFAEADVLIFTLGLTECWESTDDGAVYPLCPGTLAGTFDPARHRLRNLNVDEVAGDLRAFAASLAQVNPRARIILTVSPVPLMATAEDQHVLAATTYSKAVLRVAAETLCREGLATYFPSYEIITGAHAQQSYYAPDCRTISEDGVAHVMRSFFRHFTDGAPGPAEPLSVRKEYDSDKSFVEVLCEEESLARQES
jgi:hypothetical protein